ncbi:MAG TPA: hypothetical protein VFE17_09700, partial [Candidatus Baltobacteraceae bacterium]|nr:hypothetical protein [Candidatus Baltobacteraceae bacterium]
MVTCTSLLAACGGGGGSTSSILPGAAPTPSSTPGIQPMSVLAVGPNDELAVTGTIVALLKNGFQMEAGKGIGYFNIYTSPSTTYTNFAPAVGDFVEAAGSGSPATSMNGSSVVLLSLPSAPVTLSGQVNGTVIGGVT